MPYRLALVNYLNTFPFSEGFRLSGLDQELEIDFVIPADCAKLFVEDKVDISLCPVGALGDLPPHDICGKYCIGADGEVGTVVLLSNKPLDKITNVRLDSHSRTSNLLLQLIANLHWKKNWTFYFDQEEALPEACLMIGDKVFAHKDKYAYHFDLAEEWKAMTNLPMVFAVWVAKPGLPEAVIESIDHAFELGMQEVLKGNVNLENWQRDYLVNCISYPLDTEKMKALRLYQSLLGEASYIS